ncbi:MAG: class F420-dependent oxidoreductase [Novosphingobium sp.]|nr:class F420-dependent oxidoreductase [Novosphingobium sp.]
MSQTHNRISRIGVWSLELRFGDPGKAVEAATELDELGYGALWVPGGIDNGVLGDMDRLLAATTRVTIASGILNIWKHDPLEVAAWWTGLAPDRRERVLLGLGVSHVPIIGQPFKPVAVMREFLDKLTSAGVAPESLCLAALGPKMIELSRDRTAGAHPYLVTPEHTAQARAVLGPDRLLAPEQAVILESDPAKARELARGALATYQKLPNYRNSWQRLGFSEQEIDAVSDRLVDALFAWGSAEAIKERVDQHFAAGADHVCVQVITGAGVDVAAARPVWRELAAVLID